MPRLKAANLAATMLAQPCNNSATAIVVTSASGFPTPPFRIFVGTRDEYEIMEVTAVNGTVWTVTRAREGTTAKSFSEGTVVENRFTAGTFSELVSTDELVWANIAGKPSLFPPSNHASSHYAFGSDPISPSSILALDCEYTSRTMYVDSQYGSDTEGDGSESAPFQTFAKAISTVRQAIADGVTITITLKGRGPSYPYGLGVFGRLCVGTGRLLVQGELALQDSGNVSSGTPTTITDSTKNWTPNCWVGKLVCLRQNSQDYWRIILSNTENTLTVVGRLDVTPNTDGSYEIYDWATFLSQRVTLAGGRIVLSRLASTSQSSGQAILVNTAGIYHITQCYVSFAGPLEGIRVIADGATLDVTTCYVTGNDYPAVGIGCWDYCGTRITISRSFIRAVANALVNVWGPGNLVFITRGTVLDTSSSCVNLSYRTHAIFYSPVVNGAVDKISILNGSEYGIRLILGSSASHTDTVYVDYSGNGMDRYAEAASYAWYA